MSRVEDFAPLNDYVASQSLVRQMLAVEAAMRLMKRAGSYDAIQEASRILLNEANRIVNARR